MTAAATPEENARRLNASRAFAAEAKKRALAALAECGVVKTGAIAKALRRLETQLASPAKDVGYLATTITKRAVEVDRWRQAGIDDCAAYLGLTDEARA